MGEVKRSSRQKIEKTSARRPADAATATREQHQKQRALALIPRLGAGFLLALHHDLPGSVAQAPFPAHPALDDGGLERGTFKLCLDGHRQSTPSSSSAILPAWRGGNSHSRAATGRQTEFWSAPSIVKPPAGRAVTGRNSDNPRSVQNWWVPPAN